MKPKTVIFDSSVWIAYFYTNDSHHERALTILEAYKDCNFLIPEIVMYETLIKTYQLKQEAFDPMSPASRSITYFTGRYCQPMYAVDPVGIDEDPVTE